jgi:peptidoglycan/xylan/chitin deacetylase (PgdA/CDA1 family)
MEEWIEHGLSTARIIDWLKYLLRIAEELPEEAHEWMRENHGKMKLPQLVEVIEETISLLHKASGLQSRADSTGELPEDVDEVVRDAAYKAIEEFSCNFKREAKKGIDSIVWRSKPKRKSWWKFW